jgi:hypothetical protein
MAGWQEGAYTSKGRWDWLPHYKYFVKAPEILVAELINSGIKSSSDFIFVGESLDNYKAYAYYENYLPNWVEVTSPQLLQIVQAAVESLFGGMVPAKIGDLAFYKKVLDILKVKRFFSYSNFKAVYGKEGLGFKNGFASIKPGDPDIKMLEYDRAIFTGPPVDAVYTQPVMLGPELQLSDETKNFLQVICEEDNYK